MAKKKKRPVILSASIIAGNEENWIESIIRDCKGFADEIVVLCSGSDKTKEICLSYGCRVYDYTWIKDFADARNECLRYCRGRYVIWLDADDRVIPSQQQQIRLLKQSWLRKPKDYFFKCSLSDKKGSGPAHAMSQTRIFPKVAEKMWSGKVHESVVSFQQTQGYWNRSRETDIWIYHEGYQDPRMLEAKIKRNVELLEEDLKDGPDPIKSSYLGASLANTGHKEEAFKTLAGTYDKFDESAHKPSKFTYFMRLFPVLLQKKEWKSLIGAMNKAIEVYPNDPQPWSVIARVAVVHQKFKEALDIIEKAEKMEYEEEAGLPTIGDVHSELKELRRICETELALQYVGSVQEEVKAELEKVA